MPDEVVNSVLTITHLQIENVKRIEVATIWPSGEGLEVIGGLNEQGKSSCLDSIEYLLAGAKSLPAEPLRRGAKKGRVYAEFADGDLIVERRFTKSGSSLSVTTKDGGPYKSPQSILDKLYADHTFEPLGFLQLKPKAQVEMLCGLLGLDFTEMDKQRQDLYTERTLVNREIKTLEGQIATIPHEKVEAVDTAELLRRISEAETRNASVSTLQRDYDIARERKEQAAQLVADLERQIVEAKERYNLAVAAEAEAKERVEDFQAEDLEPLRQELARAGETNTKAQAQKTRREWEKMLHNKNADSTNLTVKIENLDAEKETLLANAKFPVEGLAFGDEGILYQGLPFEQASGEQQLLISAAMAAAQNPRLRVLLIRNGSLLDDHHLEVLRQWAFENSIQVWLEKVTSDVSECSVIFENGLIKETV